MVKKSTVPFFIGLAVASLALLHVDEIALLLFGGLAALAWKYRKRIGRIPWAFLITFVFIPLTIPAVQTIAPAKDISLTGLGFYFLKIGSILYGGGYVLVAFLQGGLVDARHWLTQTQLLDAIAVGQFTPGPILSTATFIGYVLLGFPGASAATIGIFVPSFVFVIIASPFIRRLLNVPAVRAFLDGVNASALGLMLAVCVTLAVSTLGSPVMWLIFLGAEASILLWNVHPAWLVAGSALVSWLATII